MTAASAVLRSIRALPHGDLNDILDGGTPVVLAPHPDDEVIGCGALIASAVQAGIAPVIVFVTDGSGSHPNSLAYPTDVLVALRQHEARAAAEILGVNLKRLHFMGIRDTAAPNHGPGLTDAVITIVRILAKYKKPVIFAPWEHDPHGDHQAVWEMATRAARIAGAPHYSYIVWGWTLPDDEPLGHVRVRGWQFSTKGNARLKSRALNAYQSQVSELIDDDPTGFRLQPEIIDTMLSHDEVFLAGS